MFGVARGVSRIFGRSGLVVEFGVYSFEKSREGQELCFSIQDKGKRHTGLTREVGISDLEDDEFGLLHFPLLCHNVLTQTALHPGVHCLVSVLEKFWFLHVTWT